jgi:hypothetical protein
MWTILELDRTKYARQNLFRCLFCLLVEEVLNLWRYSQLK